MLVPKMTFEEICEEMYSELKPVYKKVYKYSQEYRKVVLKSSRFPLEKYFSFTSRKKNIYIAKIYYKKRGDWNDPLMSVFCIYNKIEGNYLIFLDIEFESLIIYPPHFFRRYRERIVKDYSISNIDLIKLFIKNNNGSISTVINEDYTEVIFENENDLLNQRELFNLIQAINEGCCFGEFMGKHKIVKTIISEDMLFENQKQLYKSLKIDLHIQKLT